MTALVCATTMLFTVYVPATRGLFNMGETMVYLSAILFGPFMGAFAGGVGSMLADLLLGYYYAPATLLIKASEGFIVGFLCSRSLKLSKRDWRILTSLLGLFTSILLAFVGSTYYCGDIELTLGYSVFTQHIPQIFWLALGIIVTFSIISTRLIVEPNVGWIILSVITSGLVMVLGYFIYEAYFIGPLFGIEAIAMVVGLIVAVPVTRIIRKFFGPKSVL